MNAMQKTFCDGAAMAYRDNAKNLRSLAEKAKVDLKELGGFVADILETVAKANETKANEVYRQAETFASGVRQ